MSDMSDHVCLFDVGEHCGCVDSRLLFALRRVAGVESELSEAMMFAWGMATAMRHPEWAQAVLRDFHEMHEYGPEQMKFYDEIVEALQLEAVS